MMVVAQQSGGESMEQAHGKIDIRTMSKEHCQPVLDIINAEGWEYELMDIERILDVDPDDPVVALAGNEVVGGVTVACHKNRGVLGHVVVKNGWRKYGIGKKMMVEVLRRLDAKGIGIIELYSVPDAVDFYRKLGFRKISDLRIYKGNVKRRKSTMPSHMEIRELAARDLGDVIEMDRRISGFDRSNIIEKLMLPHLRSCVGLFEGGKLMGFALGRSAEVEAEIGPWIMERPERGSGEEMIAGTMERLRNVMTFVEIPGENPLANSIICDLGFEVKSNVQRFVRTKLEVEQFGPGVMSYSAMEFG